MPRQARIDIPGHLYHVIARGIERRKIFIKDYDYEDFLLRLEKALDKTGSKCYAFSLLGNHFHLLIMRGPRPLSELMRRLMTGYAVSFNLRHKRAGHVFQNRYKAILCQLDSYFLELVAYIHLNPLRAGIVEGLKALRTYKWCSHSAVLGEHAVSFLAKEDILGQFGSRLKSAIKKYESYLAERVNKFKPGELSGGGLIRSRGGLSGKIGRLREEEKEGFDDRILGSGDFVESVLKDADSKKVEKVSLEEVMGHVIEKTGVRAGDIFSRSQVRQEVKARALYCYLAKERCGVSGAQLMKQLGLTSGAISHLVYKGREYYKTLRL
ncbi:MAG: transposase [Deltaproteobacteria bacterium]|nr:transposase [Deltaproteobacteria bacterium]